jgi:hypothetical protein
MMDGEGFAITTPPQTFGSCSPRVTIGAEDEVLLHPGLTRAGV